MTDVQPIPKSMAEAFQLAVQLFGDWSPRTQEPDVSLEGQPYSISAICNFVGGFDDLLPDLVLECLRKKFRAGDEDLVDDLATHRSYSAGSRCLIRLIARKRASIQE